MVVDDLYNVPETHVIDCSRTGQGASDHLTEDRFNQLTEKLIYVATAGGILPSDSLAALAKALGTLSAFTARRERQKFEDVLDASQNCVASFAAAAESYMNGNKVE